MCENYRGIAISDAIAKLYEKILSNRFSLWYKPKPEQAGVQSGRGCLEHILAFRLLIDYAKTRKLKLWLMFVDFSKAYDKVPRDKLLQELKNAGCGGIFLRAIKAIYKTTKFMLKSAMINVSVGVKQGAPLSCLLFVFYVDIMIGMINSYGSDGFLGVLNTMLLMDDTVILATSRSACEKKLKFLLDFCNGYGMSINESKTKFMVINAALCDREVIVCEHVDIKYCTVYWYLGSPITDDGSMSTVMKEHVNAKTKHVLKFLSFFGEKSRYAICCQTKGCRIVYCIGIIIWF